MKSRSKDQIEAEYADILDGEDEGMWKLAQYLDAQYAPGDPLSWLPGPPTRRHLPPAAAARRWSPSRLLARGGSRSARVVARPRPRPSLALGGAALAALLLSISVVLAASGILNLGKPTSAKSSNSYFPLSGFHRDTKLPTVEKVGGKAQVLFIGTLLTGHDPRSTDERWPVVKALEQFGAFSGVKPVDHICQFVSQQNQVLCTDSTYDWSSASYHSRYVVFEHKDLLTVDDKPLQRLSKAELKLYNAITHVPPVGRFPQDPYGASYAAGELPVLAVGDYLQTSSQDLLGSDFEETLPSKAPTPPPSGSGGYPIGTLTVSSGLSFQQVQQALRTGADPKGTTLVEDVNAEANIITALICHADGNKPGSVCGRSIVRSLQKRLR